VQGKDGLEVLEYSGSIYRSYSESGELADIGSYVFRMI